MWGLDELGKGLLWRSLLPRELEAASLLKEKWEKVDGLTDTGTWSVTRLISLCWNTSSASGLVLVIRVVFMGEAY